MKKLILLLTIAILTACGGSDKNDVDTINTNEQNKCMFDDLNDLELQIVVSVVEGVSEKYMDWPMYYYLDGRVIHPDDLPVFLSFMITSKIGQELGYEAAKGLVESGQYAEFIESTMYKLPILQSTYEFQLRNCFF